jgi:hypothetical protein
MPCCKKKHPAKCDEKECLNSLKKIMITENEILLELEQAKLLISLLNCETLDTIKIPLRALLSKSNEDEEVVANYIWTVASPASISNIATLRS